MKNMTKEEKMLKEHIKRLMRENLEAMSNQFEYEEKEEDGRLSDMNTENDSEKERRSQVEKFFDKPGVNNAQYAYALYNVEPVHGKDTNAMKNARSKFEKKIHHEKNDSGYPESLSSPETVRLQNMISNSQLSENKIREAITKAIRNLK